MDKIVTPRADFRIHEITDHAQIRCKDQRRKPPPGKFHFTENKNGKEKHAQLFRFQNIFHYPVYLNQLRTFHFILNPIRYITGTSIKVKKVAKLSPKIIVQDNGPQNATLSPPKKICGFSSVKSVTKSIFSPTASGIRPSIVADAVRITGVIRVFPASTIASRSGTPCPRSRSVNSTSRIPFRTTIPAS